MMSQLIRRALGFSLGVSLLVAAPALAQSADSNVESRLQAVIDAAVEDAPGIILLVPGSIGFRSVASLLDHNVLHGVEAAFLMAMVGVSIVAGLLLANVAAPTSRAPGESHNAFDPDAKPQKRARPPCPLGIDLLP